jgi:hypothetical protein
MARYHFHVLLDEHIEWDDDGIDLPDFVVAQAAAEQTALKLRDGLLYRPDRQSRWSVAVSDAAGEILHVVSF